MQTSSLAASDAGVGLMADSTRRHIYQHIRAIHQPVSVNEIAQTFEVHRNAAKFHLDKLLEAGLLTAAFRRVNGRSGPGAGRPSKLYAATDTDVSFNIPARHYDLLADLLLRTLTSGLPMDDVGREFGGQLVNDLACNCTDPVEGLRSILDTLGFDPEINVDEGGLWVTTHNCPFGKVARDAPNLEVCRLDRAIVQGILEALGLKAVSVCQHTSIAAGQDVCVREICEA